MMKRILTAALLLALAGGAMAQGELPALEPAKQLRNELMKRDASQKHSLLPLPKPTLKGLGTKQARVGRPMPQGNVWFPGEWEEVQAIVITPYYSYYTEYSQQSDYHAADPLVPGWAANYNYSQYYGWQFANFSPYYSQIDTASDFAQVSFYLMDAIQKGGAEAWVHIEKQEDSAVVVQHLTEKGLRHNKLRFFVAPGNSFWYRDCGPICFYYGEGDTVGMLDFEYYPGRAMDDSLPVYLERHFGLPNFTTQIEWEGGNCLVDGAGMVFSSNHIYSANADTVGQYVWDGTNINSIVESHKDPLSNAAVKDSLRRLIGPRATHILTAFRYDGGTGHVDLYADMIDENQFVFSVMPEAYRSWTDYRTGKRNMDSLTSYESLFGYAYKRADIPFPSRDNGSNFRSQSEYDESYTRTYSNHTFVNNLIIQPCFSPVSPTGMPTAAWDSANIEQVKLAYPGYELYCVDVNTFDGTGGAIHCITKQIPADNPVRILHRSHTGDLGRIPSAHDLDIAATVSNRSGIASATCTWRVDGGEWRSFDLAANSGDLFYAQMPTSGLAAGTHTVDYYLTATSNNGKTITKPMTAATGGYYTFTMDSEAQNEGIGDIDAGQGFGQFFPNPATDKAQMEIDLGEGSAYAVSIIDATGRTIHTTSLQAAGRVVYTMNTSRLAAGHYTVVFSNGSERVARKLVVR